MKRIFIFCTLLCISAVAFAQEKTPLTWTFSSKKIAAGIYRLQFTATLKPGWYIGSQHQPESAEYTPTEFSFKAAKGISFETPIYESGTLEFNYLPKDDMLDAAYTNKVDFYRVIRVGDQKGVRISGKIYCQYYNRKDGYAFTPKDYLFDFLVE